MNKLTKIKKLIYKSHKIAILTGAGISTESGISDFRSPGGVWTKYKTVTIQEFTESEEKRKYYWKYKSETIPSMLKAEPNNAHKAIGRLDKMGKLFWLLTQNIDGLHEAGGVRKEKIIRLHGTNKEAVCLSCGDIQPIEVVLKRIEQGEEAPLCRKCSGYLKPNTVSFGQSLNPDHLMISDKASKECDLFMALGSSLQVFPACGFVEAAHNNKKPVIIINRDPTSYDNIADFVVNDSLGYILNEIIS